VAEGGDGPGGALGRGARVEWLDWQDYRKDFRSRRDGLRGAECWVLARRQHVVADSPLQEAITRGCWGAAPHVDQPPHVDQQGVASRGRAESEPRGGRFHCVRVVDEPLSPGLQRELRSLRAQPRCDLGVRVVPASALGGLEVRAALPEVVVLGQRTVYELVHAADGAPVGAYRRIDADCARNWAEFLFQCYTIGEDVRAYTDRRVGDLASPPGE
jgi:hypothetical protein